MKGQPFIIFIYAGGRVDLRVESQVFCQSQCFPSLPVVIRVFVLQQGLEGIGLQDDLWQPGVQDQQLVVESCLSAKNSVSRLGARSAGRQSYNLLLPGLVRRRNDGFYFAAVQIGHLDNELLPSCVLWNRNPVDKHHLAFAKHPDALSSEKREVISALFLKSGKLPEVAVDAPFLVFGFPLKKVR